MVNQYKKKYFGIDNICIANATGIKLKILSPSLLDESISEMFFLNIWLPVNHRVEGGI